MAIRADRQKTVMDGLTVYVAVAVVSAAAAIVSFGITMLLGLAIGIVGSIRGACSKRAAGVRQGFHVLFVGLAVMAGPLIYAFFALATQ